MSNKFLKGNYKTEVKKVKEDKKSVKNIKDIFESKAAEKLGGSIAFVIKSNKFLRGER